jgi:predicted phosphodiesterase
MAYMQQQEPLSNSPKRSNDDYLNPSRMESVNHMKTEIKKKPNHTVGDFFSKSLWNWFYHYFKSRFGRKFPYQSYSLPDTGVHKIPEGKEITIGITSDWATDTADSFAIAEEITKHNPEYTIHVGDTYYVGAPHEIASNFVEHGSPWVRGSEGSFAVLGNHEMYANGVAFFEMLLPSLGIKNASGAYGGQKAGYFCLENNHWRILGLDTGYNSAGKPILEFLPWFAPKCDFDDKQIDWLENTIGLKNKNDKRGIVILTHHQFISAFDKESEYKKPAKQLGNLLGEDKKIIWLWGHEHKLSLFEKTAADGSPQVYGRCIGNGGTPVEILGKNFNLSDKKKGYNKLVAVDKRHNKTVKDVVLGFNGYVCIKLLNDLLKIEYYDSRQFLLSEEWKADITTGNISGTINPPPVNLLVLQNGKSWQDAVR